MLVSLILPLSHTNNSNAKAKSLFCHHAFCFLLQSKVRHSIRSANNNSKRKAIDFSVWPHPRPFCSFIFIQMLPFVSSCSCSCSCVQGLLSQSLTTGSIRVWSWLLCPSTKKGEELRYEAVLWMETPAEETPGGWATCYKGSAAFGLVLITASLLLLVACQQDIAEARPLHSLVSGGGDPMRPHSPPRKLLRQESTVIDQPSRLPGGGCIRGDIAVIQGASIPLPNGIPAYSVEIINQCPSGCAISAIHLSCGWFSSAHLVNPRVFRRLRYDDCLVNNGMPLRTRETLSFLYANTYPYPLSVSSVSCS